MNSIIRITGAVNKVHCANPIDCLEEIKGMLEELAAQQSDIVVFPRLALCSPSCGNLFENASLLDQCEQALDELRQATAQMPGYILAGLALDDQGKAVSAMAVLYQGELVGLVPTVDDPAPLGGNGCSPSLLPPDTVFACGGLRFRVLGCAPSDLALRAADVVRTGCDLIIVPAYSPVYAGYADEAREAVKALSKAAGCAVAVVNGGVGDTSSPHIFSGFAAIYENGERLADKSGGYDSFFCTVDLGLDIIRSSKKGAGCAPPHHSIRPAVPRPGLLRPVNANPWLPERHSERYLSELFDLQVRSLAARMENIGVVKLVIGVSGGVDSTASLLVSAAAMDALGLPRENIVGITMPGFGTSDRTYYNALSLLEALEVTGRDISIRRAVQVHLEDIGHSGKTDVTYENAQARERAQILLDVANAVSGIVVGTGDLSEEALGFCTFAGDHIANYNVNVCIPKTLLRLLVRHVAGTGRIEGVGEVVDDILDTPVSPELLPPSPEGDIGQKTEEILGPYELHDFFLYYFIRYNMRPSKLYFYACIAFSEQLRPDFIKEKLRLFLRKFCAGQFKRACAPDAASITQVNLCGINYYIPSDLDPSALLRELDMGDA